jgi:hypothetical protein
MGRLRKVMRTQRLPRPSHMCRFEGVSEVDRQREVWIFVKPTYVEFATGIVQGDYTASVRGRLGLQRTFVVTTIITKEGMRMNRAEIRLSQQAHRGLDASPRWPRSLLQECEQFILRHTRRLRESGLTVEQKRRHTAAMTSLY